MGSPIERALLKKLHCQYPETPLLIVWGLEDPMRNCIWGHFTNNSRPLTLPYQPNEARYHQIPGRWSQRPGTCRRGRQKGFTNLFSLLLKRNRKKSGPNAGNWSNSEEIGVPKTRTSIRTDQGDPSRGTSIQIAFLQQNPAGTMFFGAL